MLLRLLERLARWRLPDEDRWSQDAFQRDVARQWEPVTPAERRLALRSRLSHLHVALFGGGVTLAGVGVSGILTTVGSGLLAVAPHPRNARYDPAVPTLVGLLATLGVLGLAFECARAPLHLRPRRFLMVAATPLAAGTLSYALSMRVVLPPDAALRAALLTVSAGAVVAGGGAIRRHTPLARLGLTIVGVGALGICLSDGIWVALFALDHSTTWAVGCALNASGAILMANGLLFARPTVAPA